jgi:hypothetical protein
MKSTKRQGEDGPAFFMPYFHRMGLENYEGGMTMSYKQFLLTSLLGLSLLINSGCPAVLLGGAAGAGSVAYITGELKSTEEVPMSRAWRATQKTMNDLGFAITSMEKDAFYGQIIARGAGDKKVKIKLERQSDKLTGIRIRVGTFGDEPLSLQILNNIRKRYS